MLFRACRNHAIGEICTLKGIASSVSLVVKLTPEPAFSASRQGSGMGIGKYLGCVASLKDTSGTMKAFCNPELVQGRAGSYQD